MIKKGREKLPESTESSKFVSHWARISSEFDSRKDSHSIKYEKRPQIFVKLKFRKLCDSKWSGLHPFGKMVIIHWIKNRLRVHETPILEVIFVSLTENSSIMTNYTQGPWKYPPKITVGTQFHVQHGTKTTPVCLPNDGEAFWLVLPSSVSLLAGSTVQPENTYSCILKMTGQVWERQKRISINSNHSYHQHYLLKPASTDLTIKSGSVLTNPIRKDGVWGWSML